MADSLQPWNEADLPALLAMVRVLQCVVPHGMDSMRLGDHGVHSGIVNRSRGTGTRRIQQAIEALPHIPSAPLAHRLWRHPLPRRHDLAVLPIGTGRNDARTQRQRLTLAVDASVGCRLASVWAPSCHPIRQRL